jgi:hypothetical protein
MTLSVATLDPRRQLRAGVAQGFAQRTLTVLLVVAALGLAAALGALSVVVPPATIPALVVLGVLSVLVWRTPALAAVAVIGITPLVAGIDRGRLIPALRPNEALVIGLGGLLLARTALLVPTGWRPHIRLSRLEKALVAMAVANSLVPVFFMLLRGRSVSGDDISYALVLWKFLAGYLLVRLAVRTDREIGWCVWASLAAATVVGILGFLQARDLLGVRGLLATYWAPFGFDGALAQPRGGSTLGLPAATADLMISNLALATGLWWKERRRGLLLAAVAGVCVLGVLSAAEFSSALALLVAVVCVAVALGRIDLLRYVPFAGGAAALTVLPVIEHRLAGFQGTSGLPVSWTTRWLNLETYFWPQLVSGWNVVLGVRPSARVVNTYQGTGYVWIESGYTWLLWGGGLALLAAYLWFVRVGASTMWRACRPLTTYRSVAALAALAGIVTSTVTMVFDPHITYRGSADLLFALLAIVAVGAAEPSDEGSVARERAKGERR